jgi:hypothetical protein
MSATSTIETLAPTASHGFSLGQVLSPFATAARAAGKAILAAHTRRAERELARYLERSGGRLTDDIERRMMQSLTGSNLRGW